MLQIKVQSLITEQFSQKHNAGLFSPYKLALALKTCHHIRMVFLEGVH